MEEQRLQGSLGLALSDVINRKGFRRQMVTGVQWESSRWRQKPWCCVTTVSQCRRKAANGSFGILIKEYKGIPLDKTQGAKDRYNTEWEKNLPRTCVNLGRNNSGITIYNGKQCAGVWQNWLLSNAQVSDIGNCGGWNKNVPYRLIYLNA